MKKYSNISFMALTKINSFGATEIVMDPVIDDDYQNFRFGFRVNYPNGFSVIAIKSEFYSHCWMEDEWAVVYEFNGKLCALNGDMPVGWVQAYLTEEELVSRCEEISRLTGIPEGGAVQEEET